MTEQPIKTKKKRLPKGQRTHTRRLKQEARKTAGTTPQPGSPLRPA
jgi:hypothetical protein